MLLHGQTSPSLAANRDPISALSNASVPDVSTVNAKFRAEYAKLPLAFETNQGQTDSHVKYLARGQGYTLFLTSSEAALSFSTRTSPLSRAADSSASLRIQLLGGNTAPEIIAQEELPGTSNYFIGQDPKNWRTNIPQYARVVYRDAYPGIDLAYYGNQRQLEYDIVVAPGADSGRVRFAVHGAHRLHVNRSGDLVMRTTDSEVLWHKPLVYQNVNGTKRLIACRYLIHSGPEFGFELGYYDRSKPLVIDPVLSYSTYIGGTQDDWFGSLAIDASGNAYAAGFTKSSDFPVVNPLSTNTHFAGGTYDATIVKLNATGTARLYATYLGGSKDEWARGIAVDSSGNAYVAGFTSSGDFPTVNAYQSMLQGTQNAYLAKLGSTGSTLLYSSYLGGTGVDFARGIAADDNGNAYVVGYTNSSDFPVQNALQAVYGGGLNDAFIAKFNTAVSSSVSLIYSTFLGGTGDDQATTVAIDSSGDAYIAGSTTSTNFPTLNPYQAINRGSNDIFVSEINASDSGLVFSTYLGGGGDDIAHGIAVDSTGIYVAGGTTSTNFPTLNPVQAVNGGLDDAILTKFDPTGSSLIYSTYYGGSGNEYCLTLAVDPSGRAFLAGLTDSTDFPVLNSIQSTQAGLQDGFVIVFSASGTQIIYATYFGGNSFDEIQGIAVDAAGNAYIAGETFSSNFRVTPGVVQPKYGGNGDAFVAKIQLSGPDYAINVSNTPQTIFPGQQTTFNGSLTAFNGYKSAVALTCQTSNPPLPSVCTPNPGSLTPTSSGAAFTITAAGTPADYSFNAHAVGTDAQTTTHNASVMLHVVDFSLSAPNPASISANAPNPSNITSFQVAAAGSFNQAVTLSCSALPIGAQCNFSPSSSVSPTAGNPVTVNLTVSTTSSTPLGSSVVTISANTSGAPAAKTQNVTLNVTANPDFIINITNSPQSALVTQQASFGGILTALNGYGSAVTLNCGAGAPPTCTVSPSANVTPTPSGVPFTVGVSSAKSTHYAFSINAVGSDPAHISHLANISFTSQPDFTLVASSTSQTVKAGNPAQYTLNFAPVGDATFVNEVTYSCSMVGFPMSSSCIFSPAQLIAWLPGPNNVTLRILTAAPMAALPHSGAVFAFWMPFPVTALFFAGLLGAQTRRRRMAMYAEIGLILLVVAVFQIACGGRGNTGGGSSTQNGTLPGTYTIKVIATEDSGITTVQHSATVTLVVQ
jgi:Beta-propeller repeat